MKIALLNGSPRGKNSTSYYLLEELSKSLQHQDATIFTKATLPSLCDCLKELDVLVLAFPLYVDSMPASLIDQLDVIKSTGIHNTKLKVYAIVNNGFYESKQNHVAISMVWNWCKTCGFQKGYAIGVGGGEMVRFAPLGHGPEKNLGKAMQELTKHICENQSTMDQYVEPNFPKFLYKVAAHYNWKKQIRSNGLKPKDIKRKL
ncbi:MAG: hypothetical protein RR690_04885 [Longicatena sp.]